MAMLAEPRQRKRYNLVPRGKALYEDDSRFGTKMLEKMGWSKGKGLGANEDGSKDFVRVRYKNDIEGLGYEQRDDQWTQHESCFNGLLKSLNGEEDTAETGEIRESCEQNPESDDDLPRIGFGFQKVEVQQESKKPKGTKLKEKISGVSLEERSKQSRARVHYKKFTRGKDLSQYSEKDLANIFGKKATDEQEAVVNDLYQQLSQSHTDANKNDEQEKEQNKEETTNLGGVQIINSELSVSDYFKMKMAALKNRSGQSISANATKQDNNENIEEDKEDDCSRKKKKKSRDNVNTPEVTAEIDEPTETITESESGIKKKSKKKKKKNHDNDLSELKSTEEILSNQNEIEELPKERKKSKKRKHEEDGHSDKKIAEVVRERVDSENTKLETSANSESNSLDNDKKLSKNKKKRPNSDQNDNELKKSSEESSCVGKKNETENTPSSKNASKTKKKRKDVSAAKDELNINKISELSLQELKDRLNIFNVYRLSSFCAEKFRNINLNFFPHSTLSQIEGYGLSPEIQLQIELSKRDEERITKLWENTVSKYGDLERPKKTYNKFIKDSIVARKTKRKPPRLNVKTWKRKNAFAII